MVSRAQLLEPGLLDADGIAYRLRVGRLLRVHRGVYAVGHRPPSPLTSVMAAVLACGPGAVASHLTAAALWGIHGRHATPVHVTATAGRRHSGVVAHRSRTLAPVDMTAHFGIAVTAPARTLLDLADVLGPTELARAVNVARRERLVSLDALAAQLAGAGGRRSRHLQALVGRRDNATRSHFEDAFLRFVDRFGLPRPEVNQRVAGHEVDALWRSRRLVVELDGRAFHSDEDAFEHDRERDADLLAAGYRVVRITWRRLTGQPDAEARRLRALLAA